MSKFSKSDDLDMIWGLFLKHVSIFAWNWENFDVFLQIVKNFLADLGKGNYVQLKICIQWETLEKGLSTQTSEFSKSNDLNLIWGVFLLLGRWFVRFANLITHFWRFCFLKISSFSPFLMIFVILSILKFVKLTKFLDSRGAKRPKIFKYRVFNNL